LSPAVEFQLSRRSSSKSCLCRWSVVCYYSWSTHTVWNSLPDDVTSASSPRPKLKVHLFRLSYPDIVF